MTHICPACDREFETRHGLGVHYGHIHDGHLPNRECAACGREFFSEHERKYCSQECLDASLSFEGRENPNYRDAKHLADCVRCGTSFEYYPSDKDGVYCSSCVESESWRDPPSNCGATNPRWRGGKRVYTCDVCGDSVERYPSNVTGEVVLCSEDCRSSWLSDAFRGEGHPNWQGGGNENYGSGWNKIRQQALERDEYQCIICGKTKSEIGRNPDVHHIVPVRWFDEIGSRSREDAHHLSNVVCLCISCHRKADFGKITRKELRAQIDDA